MNKLTFVFFAISLLLTQQTTSKCTIQNKGCTGCLRKETCLVSKNKCFCIPTGFLDLFTTKNLDKFESKIEADEGDCKKFNEPCENNQECCSLYCKQDTKKCHFF